MTKAEADYKVFDADAELAMVVTELQSAKKALHIPDPPKQPKAKHSAGIKFGLEIKRDAHRHVQSKSNLNAIDVLKFIVMIPILPILGLIWLFSDKCPQCNAGKTEVLSEQCLNTYYLHTRRDGGADRRYSYNPLKGKFRIHKKCKKCAHTWTTTVERNA